MRSFQLWDGHKHVAPPCACFVCFFKHSSACCHVIWHDGCNDDGGSCHYQAERMLRLKRERLQLSCNGEASAKEETRQVESTFFCLGYQATDQEDITGTKVNSTQDSKSKTPSLATRGQLFPPFSVQVPQNVKLFCDSWISRPHQLFGENF